PRELPARRLDHPAALDEANLADSDVEHPSDAVADLRFGPAARIAIGSANRLAHDDDPIGAEPLVGYTERDDTAGSHAFDLARNRLEVVRHDVVPGDDDQIFLAAADIELAVGEVAKVSGLEPAVAQRGSGEVAAQVVAAAPRTAHQDLADGAVGQHRT